jgi:hypothetical protein
MLNLRLDTRYVICGTCFYIFRSIITQVIDVSVNFVIKGGHKNPATHATNIDFKIK